MTAVEGLTLDGVTASTTAPASFDQAGSPVEAATSSPEPSRIAARRSSGAISAKDSRAVVAWVFASAATV